MEEQVTAMTRCCNIMMRGHQQTVGPTTSETSAIACVHCATTACAVARAWISLTVQKQKKHPCNSMVPVPATGWTNARAWTPVTEGQQEKKHLQ
jgi:hypothetical protein